MNKKFILILSAIVLTAFLVVGTAKAINLYYIASSQSGVASTTSSFVIGGVATTTKTIVSDGFEQVSFLVALASSSTPPTLCWSNQYSNNGTDWYGEDQAYASSTIHVAADKQECWLYATTSASTIISRGTDGNTLFIGRKVVVPNLDTQYTRTIFSVQPGVSARWDIQSSFKNEVIQSK